MNDLKQSRNPQLRLIITIAFLTPVLTITLQLILMRVPTQHQMGKFKLEIKFL